MSAIKFITPTTIPKSDIAIEHQVPILLIGSCFAQNIGEKLINNKFQATINPFGIIYNPISVFKSLKRIVKNENYTQEELFQINNKWISFDHHGSFSSFDKKDCLERINVSLKNAHNQLTQSKTIFITLGSAWVYEYPKTGIVANCHKIPNNQFTKRLLTVKEILTAFDELQEAFKNFKIVFTVSPVRHVKDGLHENNLSKSTLHLAINNMVEQNKNCSYFPAYELIIDELRDYRFYATDLVHPSEMAINYVWEKFSKTYFDEETIHLIDEIQKIKAAVNHRPFNFEGAEHQEFIIKQIHLMNKLSTEYIFLEFTEEIQDLKNQKNLT